MRSGGSPERHGRAVSQCSWQGVRGPAKMFDPNREVAKNSRGGHMECLEDLQAWPLASSPSFQCSVRENVRTNTHTTTACRTTPCHPPMHRRRKGEECCQTTCGEHPTVPDPPGSDTAGAAGGTSLRHGGPLPPAATPAAQGCTALPGAGARPAGGPTAGHKQRGRRDKEVRLLLRVLGGGNRKKKAPRFAKPKAGHKQFVGLVVEADQAREGRGPPTPMPSSAGAGQARAVRRGLRPTPTGP